MIEASALFDLISQHTTLACLAIILITALECLALVGLFLPGTLLIFFFGTLAGTGLLPPVAVLGCTFLGAFLGDTCSYWLGRRYHQEIKGLQLLRKHQALFRRGQDFFHRHGGKGLIFGRFVGPLRPLVPLVAGMMNFSPLRFVLISICSCVVWTIVYLFPGMFFGSSLVVVAQISGRLATIILLVTVLFLSTAWLFRLMARGLETAGFLWMTNVGKWLNTRPAPKKMAHALRQFVRPTIRPYREPEGLGAFLLLFSLCMFGLFAFAFHPGTDWHTALGSNSLAHFFHSLQTFWTLHALMLFSALGRQMVLFSGAGMLIMYLALSRHLRSAAFLGAAIIGAQLLALVMQGGPQGLFPWADQVFSSSTLIVDPVLWPPVYAFPAILAYTRYHYGPWWIVFWVVFCLTCLIGIADLWLGRWTVPQIVYGMSLGWGWTCVLGFAYLQNPENDFPGLSSIFLWLGILLVILPWQTDQIRQAYPQALVQPQPPISYNTWVQEGWRQVPTYREDIQGQEKQPLNIQFYGDTLELAQQLSQSGWEQAAGFSFRRMLAHFSPDSDIHDLLVLPSLHKGYPETLRMSKKMEDCRLILRLWSVAGGENEENPSLWVGMVGKQVRREYLGLFSLAVQDGRHDFGIDQLLDDLGPGYTTEYEKRRSVRIQGWDGRVTLVYKKAQPKETDQPGPS